MKLRLVSLFGFFSLKLHRLEQPPPPPILSDTKKSQFSKMRPSIVCLFVWKQNPSDSKNHAYHPLTIAIVTISKQFSKEIDPHWTIHDLF